MQASNINSQRGYVLLLVVLMFMGIGGVVLAGFTQQARDDLDEQRYTRNQRVLEQAKQALLMFAYNYPQSNNRGPGRLPCPDHDNDGFVDFPLDCDTVGRFPWRDARLNIQQTLDASGETLWYAVSNSFDNEAGGAVNSDTLGSITLVDQSDGILYDGQVAGIAAVIIAPGPVVKRDEDANGTYEFTQLRATGLQQIDPRNYLDTFNGFDNSVFTNDESDTNDDGFILGPVYDDAVNEIVVNDQIIIITADEVIAMAEKRVLEAYRDAIDLYQQNLWAVLANYRFPWLHAYDDITDLDIYDVQPGDFVGRVPFQNYYEDSDSQHVVVTDLQIDFDVTLALVSMVDNGAIPGNETYIDGAFGDLFTNFNNPPVLQTLNVTAGNLSFANELFDGTAPDPDNDDIGTMISATGGAAALAGSPSLTVRRFFWDGTGTPLAMDGWELCPGGIGDSPADCARDINPPHNPVPFTGGSATDFTPHAEIRIRVVELQLEVDPFFVLELDYDPAPGFVYTQPGALANASFDATFTAAAVSGFSVADAVETNDRNFVDIVVTICEQDNLVGSSLSLDLYTNADADTFSCMPGSGAPEIDLATNASGVWNSPIVITADYYPEVPLWVAENGWDDAVMMAYMTDFAPGPTTASCTPEDGDTGSGAPDDCLVISNVGGVNNDFSALLVLAGEHDLVDEGANNFLDDLADIFEPENNDVDLVFDRREQAAPGNSNDTVFPLGRL